MSTKSRKTSRRAKPASRKRPSGALATNRRATFDYEILETYEAGLALVGTEIKSIRAGRVSLAEAYARPDQGELWLYNMHVPAYKEGAESNHEPTRPRKLLLHKWQIKELMAQVSRKGLTIIPLRLYIKNRVAKVAIGLAKGKRRYQKKQLLIERAVDRDIQRVLKGD